VVFGYDGLYRLTSATMTGFSALRSTTGILYFDDITLSVRC
jgi:hypothetical protein